MERIAIITGATGGIGQKFIEKITLQEDIDCIWAVGRNSEKLRALAEKYDKVNPIETDLAGEGISLISDKLKSESPVVSILINNAGTAYMGAFEKMESSKIEELCNINCSIPAMLIHTSLPYMTPGSRVINISSASSFQPNPYLSMYSASKAFLKNLSRALSVELKPKNIFVTCVCPGWVDTGMLPRSKDGKEIKYPGMISAERVVSKALKDSSSGKDMSVPGLFAKYFRLYSKITPTGLIMKQWVWGIRKYI
ncbi:MAG: SDR family NAD(P)-dependent oxidoreductase [Lachnospiraceae bacterium]|nr:SDR family NAD(P)-dependent oxidoreductase [Lachnospiraceae bacterium]